MTMGPTRRSPAPRSTRPAPPRSNSPAADSVTETEVGDEESYYEVEVTLDDGTQVDVQLDRSFKVVAAEADHEDDGSGGADDD